jgi:hypothetical protein
LFASEVYISAQASAHEVLEVMKCKHVFGTSYQISAVEEPEAKSHGTSNEAL